MQRTRRPLLAATAVATVLAAAILAQACRSERVTPEPAPSPAVRLAPSALAAVVRALETLEARRPAGSLVHVRAVECDSLHDHLAAAEYVRVYLHLTVYGGSGEHARDAFELLRKALVAEAGAAREDGPVSAARVQHALGELDWDPSGREDLVSYSDAVRLEVVPALPVDASAVSAHAGPAPSQPLETYVRTLAAREIGAVDLSMSMRDPAPGVSELVCRIEEGQPSARHTRADIAAFLAALESDSPAARLTGLKLERSQHEPDPHAERAWRFEALLTVRVLASEAWIGPALAGS